MASGVCPDHQLRCHYSTADQIPISCEATRDPTTRDDGPGFSTSLLRAPAILFRRTCNHGLYTDGVTEAANENDEEFGERRLVRCGSLYGVVNCLGDESLQGTS